VLTLSSSHCRPRRGPCGAPPVAGQGVGAQQQHRRRLGGLHGGEDGPAGARRVAGLGSVRRVALLASLARRLRVVVDHGSGLGQRPTGEVRAEPAGLDDRHRDAQRSQLARSEPDIPSSAAFTAE
jgi:hypothetical protein